MKHIYYLGFFVILFLICGCRSKKGTREEVILLYEQGKQWEEASQADSAAAYYLRSFQLAKELGEDSLIGKIGNALGDILNMQSLYNHAISVHREAYLYNSRLKDKTAASHSLRGIGKDYISNMSENNILYRMRLDSALMYFSKAECLIPEIENSKEISSIYNNLCVYYTLTEKYVMALDYNKKAIYSANDSLTICRNYLCRGNLFYSFFQYDSVIYYCRKAMKSNDLFTQYSGCHQLANALAQMGSADSAFYYKKAYGIHDEIEKRKYEEEILQLFQKSTQERMEREKNFITYGIIFSILISAIVIVILFIRHNKYKKMAQQERDNIIQQKNGLDKRLYLLEEKLHDKDSEQRKIEQEFLEKERECSKLQKIKEDIILQKEDLSKRLFSLEGKLLYRDNEQKKIEQEFLEKEKECAELQKIKEDIISQKGDLSKRLFFLEEKLQCRDNEQKKIEQEFLEKEKECAKLQKIKEDIIQQKENLNERLYSLEAKLQNKDFEHKRVRKELYKKEKECAELQKINEEVLAHNMAEKQLLELIFQKESLGKEKIGSSYERYRQEFADSYLKSQSQVDFFELVQRCFSEYIQILESRFELKERETIICCLVQLGFTKQECANCIKVSLGAYYTIVSRLKTKIEQKFSMKEEISLLLLKEKG